VRAKPAKLNFQTDNRTRGYRTEGSKAKMSMGPSRCMSFNGDLQKQYVPTDPVPAVRELSEMRMPAIEAPRASSESHRLPPYFYHGRPAGEVDRPA
jgi:hypothetical protein